MHLHGSRKEIGHRFRDVIGRIGEWFAVDHNCVLCLLIDRFEDLAG